MGGAAFWVFCVVFVGLVCLMWANPKQTNKKCWFLMIFLDFYMAFWYSYGW